MATAGNKASLKVSDMFLSIWSFPQEYCWGVDCIVITRF